MSEHQHIIDGYGEIVAKIEIQDSKQNDVEFMKEENRDIGPTDEEIWQGAVIISLGRIYDVLLSLYALREPDKANELRDMHAEGKMFFPPPAYIGEDE